MKQAPYGVETYLEAWRQNDRVFNIITGKDYISVKYNKYNGSKIRLKESAIENAALEYLAMNVDLEETIEEWIKENTISSYVAPAPPAASHWFIFIIMYDQ